MSFLDTASAHASSFCQQRRILWRKAHQAKAAYLALIHALAPELVPVARGDAVQPDDPALDALLTLLDTHPLAARLVQDWGSAQEYALLLDVWSRRAWRARAYPWAHAQ